MQTKTRISFFSFWKKYLKEAGRQQKAAMKTDKESGLSKHE
jgi:hypothetical protein